MASFLQILKLLQGVFERLGFSSLSESGFIPTSHTRLGRPSLFFYVLISFREWLHSYIPAIVKAVAIEAGSSHLFQRVASFLPVEDALEVESIEFLVLISFREWLHSYPRIRMVAAPSGNSSHLFQRVASFLPVSMIYKTPDGYTRFSSLSESGFIPTRSLINNKTLGPLGFSSLSESGFIPTRTEAQ